jgi:hypothetical protein
MHLLAMLVLAASAPQTPSAAGASALKETVSGQCDPLLGARMLSMIESKCLNMKPVKQDQLAQKSKAHQQGILAGQMRTQR